MSTPNPIVDAAIPSAIAALQAIKQFNLDMGADPTKWVLNYPGASLKLLGTLQMQVPSLLDSEGAAAQATVNTKIDSWIASLQAKLPKS